MAKKEGRAGVTKELLLRNRIHINLGTNDVSVDSHDASLEEVLWIADMIVQKLGGPRLTPKEFKEKIRRVGIN